MYYRRYLTTYISCFVLILIGTGIWSHFATRSSSEFYRLYQYQLSKLGHIKGPIETLLVGDSSLGNAIDAGEFTALSGSRTVSLALTGAYGYAGSLNLIRRALRVHKPRNVIIMQTADMLTRNVEYMAYLLTWDGNGFALPTYELARAYLEYLALIFNRETMIRNLRYSLSMTVVPQVSERDFIWQRKRITITPRLIQEQTPSLPYNPAKLHFLRQIAALCTEEQLNCIYTHGPLLAEICVRSSAYLEVITQVIRKNGLTLPRGSPICIPEEEIGDTVDHVGPAFKLAYTRKYHVLLASLLK